MTQTLKIPRARVNPDASIRRESISKQQHCIVVDDFLQNPHELVEYCAGNAHEFAKAKSYYPGLFTEVDADAMSDIHRFLKNKMSKQFPFFKADIKLSSFCAMATLQPEELSPLQRLCHTDPAPDPGRTGYAGILYLFENDKLGGTSFFRYWYKHQLLKEVEAIEREDPDRAHKFLLKNFPTFRNPAKYMTESNEIAELIATIPARFNRMIFYSGQIPHSAAITAPDLLSNDCQQGRLTLNLFADVLPKSV